MKRSVLELEIFLRGKGYYATYDKIYNYGYLTNGELRRDLVKITKEECFVYVRMSVHPYDVIATTVVTEKESYPQIDRKCENCFNESGYIWFDDSDIIYAQGYEGLVDFG